MPVAPNPGPQSTTHIVGGAYRVGVQTVVGGANGNGGTTLAPHAFSIDLNSYAMASGGEVHCTLNTNDGNASPIYAPDWVGMLQANPKMPIALQVSYEQVSQTEAPSGSLQLPTRFQTIESGYIDEVRLDLAANEVSFVFRTEISILQDTRIAGVLETDAGVVNYGGSNLVTYLLRKYTPQLASTARITPSPIPLGTDYSQAYQHSARGHSAYDYIAEAAQRDGYIVTCHNGQVYYGPAGVGAPQINLGWGSDFTDLTVTHNARRAREIAVIVYGYNEHGMQKILGRYSTQGGSGGGATETYNVFVGNSNNKDAVRIAQNVYNEITTKEILIDGKLIPDANLIRTISTYGSNFLVGIAGVSASVDKPSKVSPVYHCKQARLEFTSSEEEASLSVNLALENHVAGLSGASS